jgi:hypothetical protein
MSSLESMSTWWDGFAFWFTVIGVFLTFMGGMASIVARRYARELATEKANVVRVREEQTKLEIENAKRAAAEADARAAEANLELAKFKAPRQLSSEQSNRITESIKKWSGTRFTLAVFNDPEAIAFMSQIETALLSAGWIETDWKGGGALAYTRAGRPNVGITLLQGLFVQADSSHATDFGWQVGTLVANLKEEGLHATAEVARMVPQDGNIDVIQIQVGKK